MVNKEDERLIDAALRGERLAQTELYERYHGRLFGICLRYAGSRAEAEDFLLEIFQRIFAGLGRFRRESSLYTWMRRIAMNTILMQLRKKRAWNFTTLELRETDRISDPRIINRLAAEDIHRTLQKLPRGFRLIFNLYAIEGFTHREIARELGISEGTSRSQYARARKALQHLLVRDHSFCSLNEEP